MDSLESFVLKWMQQTRRWFELASLIYHPTRAACNFATARWLLYRLSVTYVDRWWYWIKIYRCLFRLQIAFQTLFWKRYLCKFKTGNWLQFNSVTFHEIDFEINVNRNNNMDCYYRTEIAQGCIVNSLLEFGLFFGNAFKNKDAT